MYDVFNILRHIKNNKKFYILLLIELIICFTMIIIGIDEQAAYSKRHNIYNKLEDENVLFITDDSGFLSDFNLNESILDLNDNDFIYGKSSYIDYIVDNNVDTLKLVYANPKFFKQFLKFNPKEDTVYMSNEVYKKMNSNMFFLDDKYKINGDIIEINGNEFKAKQIKDIDIIPTSTMEDNDIDPNNSIYILNNKDLGIQYVQTVLATTSKDNDYIINKLYDSSNKKLFAKNLKSSFEKGSDSQADFVRLFGWVSYICLIVVFLGTCGVMLLFIEKREKELRIEYLFGARPLRLIINIFFEILIVTIFAVFISVLIAIFIEPKVSSAYYLISFSVKSFLTLLMVSMIMSVLIAMISTKNLKLEVFRKWVW